MGYRLSAIGYQLSVISYQLSVIVDRDGGCQVWPWAIWTVDRRGAPCGRPSNASGDHEFGRAATRAAPTCHHRDMATPQNTDNR